MISILFFTAWSLAGWACAQASKAVFAHFMVGNTRTFTQGDWQQEISYAQAAGIDAFALNMAYNDSTNTIALPLAFAAAQGTGFRLFFSFDYAGHGAWPQYMVIATIQDWASHPAYFQRGSQPFVSTFEGPGNMTDWPEIKRQTGCFFMPDWSSIGAKPAADAGIADGLFSWDAWPKGPANMTTYPDASYYDFLHGLPYMMPVSPWFYTNMPGYDKNWLWRGDDLWFHRWQQVLSLDKQPDYIQIISWNDFGESHYIGPLNDKQYIAFDIGRAPFNYVKGMPHDGWRTLLPYIISLYKTGKASISRESLTTWYRLNPNGACADGDTTGNTASQLQLEFNPNVMMEDRIFYSALLTSPAEVTVSIGGAARSGRWDSTPYGGVGIYHGSVAISGSFGDVMVTLSRGGKRLMYVSGASITSACTMGLQNYNAWAGSVQDVAITPVSSGTDLASLNCTHGFGVYDFIGLCDFVCANGYCPSTACVCLNKGVAKPPPATSGAGYPLPGKSIVYAGLCNFACNHGYCPDTICGRTPNTGSIPTSSPFLPPACTGGTGAGAFLGLCSFGCNFGFCPMHACTCTSTGVLIDAPPKIDTKGYFLGDAKDYGLCNFACSHGYCADVCGNSTTTGGSDPGRDGGAVVTLDPAVWAAPTAQCPAPCTVVFPPSTLTTPTTISFPPFTTSLQVGWSTTETVGDRISTVFTAITVTTTLMIPAVTTSVISYSNFHVTTGLSGAVPPIILAYPSISPLPFVITPTFAGVTASAVPRTIRPPPWPFATNFGPLPTSTPRPSSSTSTTVPGIVPWPDDTDPVAATTFPTGTISWVTQWIPKPTVVSVDGHLAPVIPCWAWFIWFCPPHVGGFVLRGWTFPGIYPRGGPPPVGPGPFPPGFRIPTITWPQITLAPDLTPRYPDLEPDDESCKTATARICTYTESYDALAKHRSGGPTPTSVPTTTPAALHPNGTFTFHKRATTTATTTISFCTSVTGCGSTDITDTRTTAATSTATVEPHVIIPRNPKNIDQILEIRVVLSQQQVNSQPINAWESRTDTLGTLFFFIPQYSTDQAAFLRNNYQDEVLDVYIPRGILTALYWGPQGVLSDEGGGPQEKIGPTTHPKSNVTDGLPLRNRGEIIQSFPASGGITAPMTLLSWPDYVSGSVPWYGGEYKYDSSAGFGTFVYGIDWGITPSHDEFSDLTISYLYPGPNAVNAVQEQDTNRQHGSKCMAKAAGKTLGIARRAQVVQTIMNRDRSVYETFIDAFARVHEDIRSKNRATKAVINFSVSVRRDQITAAALQRWAYVIRELIAMGTPVVTGSGNGVGLPDGYPALFGDPQDANHIPELIVVGASDAIGMRFDYFNRADWVTCYAPGVALRLPNPEKGQSAYMELMQGTSFSSATVAGLIAYYRGLDPDGLTTVSAVKQEILYWAYKRYRPPQEYNVDGRPKPPRVPERDVIFNGQIAGVSLVGRCNNIKPRGTSDTNDYCPGNSPLFPSSVTFHTGLPSPTCSSGPRCGSLCVGFFCDASPFRTNPDFLDPRNPDSVQNPLGPNYGDWAGSKVTETTRSYPHPGIPSFTPPTRTSTSYLDPTETSHPHRNVIQILKVLDQAPEPFDGYERSWYWFRQVVDGKVQDKCGRPLAAFTVDDAPGDLNPVQFPDMPPTKDFHDLEVFPGYNKCKYTGWAEDDADGFGSFKCQSTGDKVITCEYDSAEDYECRGDIPASMFVPIRRPLAVCEFPPL